MIISVISLFYQQFRDNVIVSMAMAGMLAGVAAVLADVVISMAQKIFRSKKIVPILTMIGAFVAVQFFNVGIIPVILVCGVIGALTGREKKA